MRCATLAASSHNTQPWRFRAGQDGIEVSPDLGRRCSAVDPDEHHLFVSLGGTAESIVQAAPGLGLAATPDIEPDSGWVRIAVQPSSVPPSDLMDAIAHRQCTRADYDGGPVPPGHLQLLEAAGRQPGAAVQLFIDRPWLERFLPLLLAANSAQMADAAFVAELKAWIRFGYGDAELWPRSGPNPHTGPCQPDIAGVVSTQGKRSVIWWSLGRLRERP